MNRVFLNDQTITDFIRDAHAFDHCAVERFTQLDADGDGALSWSDLCHNLGAMFTKEEINDLFDKLFDQFDTDRDGVIHKEDFKLLLKEMMLALARGIGCLPFLIALEENSLFMKAVDHEIELERRKSEMAEEKAAASTSRCCKSPRNSSRSRRDRRARLSSSSLFMCFACGHHSVKDHQVTPA